MTIRYNSKKKPTHSYGNTPSLHSGPNRETFSNSSGLAPSGFQFSILVIRFAIGLMLTKSSNPLSTPRHVVSAPPKPAGLNRDSWARKIVITGPRILSSSSEGSNLRVRSSRNGSISESVRTNSSELECDVESSGTERAESERSGFTNSCGPTARLLLQARDWWEGCGKYTEVLTWMAEGTCQDLEGCILHSWWPNV